MSEDHFNALPVGYKLYEYTVKSVLGHGGFGITYLAYDENLNKDVAIKEYLPAEFAVRQGEQTVRPRSTADTEDYEWGLERFMKEAQTLALFRHQSIVPVYRFFKGNGTAYMVMEYQEGKSLAALMREHRGEFTEEDLVQLVEPILDGLAEVHKAGYLHRDVKPGNIYIRQDGSPVLLDFGAARAAVGRKSQNLTSIVTPGYAPLEQYYADGNQGPWTDIYALAAILYQAVAGRIPPEAPARVKNDPIEPCVEVGKSRFSPLFLAAIDRALMVEEEHRPQSTIEWRDMLIGRIPASPDGAAPAAAPVAEGGATMLAGSPGAGQTDTAAAAATAGPTAGPTAAAQQAAPFSSREPVSQAPRQKSGGAVKVAVIAFAAVLLISLSAAAGYFILKESGGLGESTNGSTTATNGKTNGKTNGNTTSTTEAERRAEEERKRAEAERQRQAEETERKRQAEELERKRLAAAEAERKRQAAEAERRRQEEQARRQAEEERKRAESERQRQSEEERARREEEARRRAEEERKRREEERKRTETANLPQGTKCSGSLPALNGHYSNATDCFYVRRVFISALSTGIRGSTSRWRNSRTGNSGTLTVLQAIQRPDGTFCRRFQQTLSVKGQTHRGVGLACFIGNQWQVSS